MNRRTFLHVGAAMSLTPRHLVQTAPAARIRLITRGDDLGCARSLNRAMLECFERGILRNCFVLAPRATISRRLSRH